MQEENHLSEIKSDDEPIHIKPPRCLCKLQDKIRVWWDLFIMVLATWNCFSIPFTVAFQNDFSSNIYLDSFNSLIDFLFVIDVFVNFRTTYQDSLTGEEIYSSSKLAFNYIKGKFFIDLLASLPMDFFGWIIFQGSTNTIFFQMFGLLKLVRILRLSRLIAFLNLH